MNIPVFKLEEYLSHHEFTAQYLLCCSDAESWRMSEILAMASDEERKRWDELKLGYTEVSGLSALRERIAKTLYPDLNADHITCFSGAEEAIFCALYCLIEDQDHVIVLTPCYQSLLEVPKLKGAAVSEVKLKEENQWRIDLNEIESNIRPNTRWVIINFPHNPTGQVIEENELKDLITLCDKHGIALFSDEVYRLLGNPRQPWASPAAIAYSRAISVGVMSKSFGMAGLRLGWIACQNKKMLKSIEYMKHYTSICNAAPSEILAHIALHNKEQILARNNRIVTENLSRLDTFFAEYQHLFAWVRPQGGCVGFVKYQSQESVDTFCHRLVQEKGVLLMSASCYDYPSNHFRIGLGRANMPEGLEQLKGFLDL